MGCTFRFFYVLLIMLQIFCCSCAENTSEIEINDDKCDYNDSVLTSKEIPDFDKYYKPQEFKGIDMFDPNAKWSWYRYAQSEHFFVFWEKGFGENPNSDSVPENLKVDINDLLNKAEEYFRMNVDTLKFAEVGKNISVLDKYKLQIYLLYQTDWAAYGAGYDDVIGAIWINPSTCKPVGSTIAHEIGHAFQYQVYCDLKLQGLSNSSDSGFRYGNGAIWEQCAQWQAYQSYPVEMFSSHNFNVWVENCHRHFNNEMMRYASYWLQSYWKDKHGADVLGKLWRNSKYPDDIIQTYMRMYCNDDWETMKLELYDYASRMATFDIKSLKNYSNGYLNKYKTTFYRSDDGYYQIAYNNCLCPTGYNVIELNLPESNNLIKISFTGLSSGSDLSSQDPGSYSVKNEIKKGITTYNLVNAGNEGWIYGCVALLSDGTRKYSEVYKQNSCDFMFDVPNNTEHLYFVVLGAPKKYNPHNWDDNELNDEQCPYKVRFSNTDLKGNYNIDYNANPTDIDFTFDVSFHASKTSYDGIKISLYDNEILKNLSKAFVMQPSEILSRMLEPNEELKEGYISFAAITSDNSIEYHTTANGYGFWFDSNGDVTTWSVDNDSKVFVEFSTSDMEFIIGQFPGKLNVGDVYKFGVVLNLMDNSKIYSARFNFKITIE